jgi:rhodanese-related sulfurtransferase
VAIAEITVEELAERLDQGIRLIDVREVDEYADGHVPGAELIVLGAVPDNVDRFRGDGPTYLICRSGGRSMRACQFLHGEGIDTVNVAGGTMAWTASGRPVVTGGDSPS